MTTDEKLKHFLDTSMEDAKNQSETMINEYTAALDKLFEEHKAETTRRMELRLKTEKERQSREKNKELALKQIAIRHEITDKSEELTNMIFVEVEDMLEKFMQTPDYEKLLVKQIKEALDFAGGEPMTIYIDPSDASLQATLELATGAQIELSPASFKGGTRAIIHSRNILIDNSFEQKLEEARDGFTLTGK
ncbi:MAG: V-type ATP synthase subunit E [Lachnospiraceae bacterium]